MRRADREITDRTAIDALIRRCRVCRLAFCDEGEPYIVPMSFGYDGRALYFHSAPEGRKVRLLERRPRLCFELDLCSEPKEAPEACGWSLAYESVVGLGRAEILGDREAKRRALSCIMRQYSSKEWTFAEASVAKTLVFRLTIEELTAKRSAP